MVNRLAGSRSRYLLQHADNPVQWWPWGDEAFAEAQRRQVPVLLSIGYAACHWCHVMARESFEDPALAQVINTGFLPVKVDREERPEVDAVYMSATQALTGHGGWPMTCFLTPAGQPFYAGTYFPPQARHGLPGFGDLLAAIRRSWVDDRDAVTDAAARITAALADPTGPGPIVDPDDAADRFGPGELAVAARALIADLDPIAGGFIGAPKFPPALALEFLLRHHEATGSSAVLDAAQITLTGMARGGLFDQIGGGFARYSTDSRWHVPHFEKMLDDNAQLLRVYAHHARLTGSSASTRVAEQTAAFLLRELSTPAGAFAAALDADTHGVEGATYLWTAPEMLEVLGPADGAAAVAAFGLDRADQPAELAGGVLRLVEQPADLAWWDRIRERLAEVRAARPQPLRDDIVVLRGNGLAVAALAEAGAALGHRDWITAAEQAVSHVSATHRTTTGWVHSSWNGAPGPAGAVLTDLAAWADGLLCLHQAGGDPRLLADAIAVLDQATDLFADARTGRYADTAADAEPLFLRPRDPADGVAPSGPSALAAALLTAAELSGRDDLRSTAEQILAAYAPLIRRAPRAAVGYLAVAEALAAGPVQVAVAGPPGQALDELAGVARRTRPGGSVVEVGEPDAVGRPLLAGRPAPGGVPAAYVCRGFVCDRPVVDPSALAVQLRGGVGGAVGTSSAQRE